MRLNLMNVLTWTHFLRNRLIMHISHQATICSQLPTSSKSVPSFGTTPTPTPTSPFPAPLNTSRRGRRRRGGGGIGMRLKGSAGHAVIPESQEASNFGPLLLLSPLLHSPFFPFLVSVGFLLTPTNFFFLLLDEFGWNARRILLSGEKQIPQLGAKLASQLGRQETWRTGRRKRKVGEGDKEGGGIGWRGSARR